jgi:hypothetical protein
MLLIQPANSDSNSNYYIALLSSFVLVPVTEVNFAVSTALLVGLIPKSTRCLLTYRRHVFYGSLSFCSFRAITRNEIFFCFLFMRSDVIRLRGTVYERGALISKKTHPSIGE